MSLVTLLTSAAFAPIENIGWIRVTGADRVRWLNGMVTNSIQSLKPGEGCYNFFLNAQGRIQGDATAWMLEDSILLETAADRVDALMAMLDHFIIMDDVELASVEHRTGLSVVGPNVAGYLHALGLAAPDGLSMAVGEDEMTGTESIHAHSPIVPVFEVWSDEVTTEAIAETLRQADEPIAESTAQLLEQLRIVEGTPKYGVDIRDKELPQETGQTRALHFSKGCYLGQEIVERIRSRGNVHRMFSGFVLTGELPAVGVELHDGDKSVGELTSVTRIELPDGPVQLALGYIRREAVERGATITYPGGVAAPASLPFQLPTVKRV